MNRLLVVLLLLSVSGCYVETVAEAPPPSYGPRPSPVGAEPSSVRVVDRADLGARIEGGLSGQDVAVGYVTALAQGAKVTASLSGPAGARLFAYGPLAEGGWASAPILARGAARLELTAPSDGSYLFAVLGPVGSVAPFSLELACASGECRVQCAADGGCPSGAQCAWVQCIRAPCPSYCQAMVEPPPAAGAICGTRGAAPCGEGEVCIYPQSAQCGETDAPGTCQPRVEVCTREYNPVCGCDGQTYGTECMAHAAGVSVRSAGECGAPPPEAQACVRSGCGGELCTEPGNDMATICVARPEHACYRTATCERQPNGQCGWTQTRPLRACLASPPR